jgi:hypothetical protein
MSFLINAFIGQRLARKLKNSPLVLHLPAKSSNRPVWITDHAYQYRPPDVGWQAWMLDCIEKAETVLVVFYARSESALAH